MEPINNTATDEVPTPVGYQRTLFPLDVVDIYNNDLGTADLLFIATASNQKDYAVKTVAEGNGHIPATELFCYELAGELSIHSHLRYFAVEGCDSGVRVCVGGWGEAYKKLWAAV